MVMIRHLTLKQNFSGIKHNVNRSATYDFLELLLLWGLPVLRKNGISSGTYKLNIVNTN